MIKNTLVIAALFVSATFAQSSSWTTLPIKTTDVNYKLDYLVLNPTDSNASVFINLTVSGVNTTDFVPGKSGVWIGLGYGNNQMKNVDYNMFLFNQTSATTANLYLSNDGYFDGNRQPV